MKIAIWKIGALGDVLMTTPLVRQLRRACPSAQIDYVIGRSSAVVIQGNPNLDRVVTFDEAILYERKLGKLRSIVDLLRGYDVIFVLDKHWIFALLARIASAPVRIGFSRRPLEGALHTKRVPYREIRHEIDYYLDLGRAFGIAIDPHDVRLELPQAQPYALETPYTVLINSGGNNVNERSFVRRLPNDLFKELVRRCAAGGVVVFLGASNERAFYAEFESESTLNLCGQITLQQAWDVLSRAQAVYTTDTGLMHMAAAVNSRVTGIFGPTHPGRKCPPGANSAWVDQDIYEPGYELLGTLPKKSFFGRMSASRILGATGPWDQHRAHEGRST
jgi:ADP-heptose:LPS heptosyltransferase